jgi:hypothetical protein
MVYLVLKRTIRNRGVRPPLNGRWGSTKCPYLQIRGRISKLCSEIWALPGLYTEDHARRTEFAMQENPQLGQKIREEGTSKSVIQWPHTSRASTDQTKVGSNVYPEEDGE